MLRYFDMSASSGDDPVVERNPVGTSDDLTGRALLLRIRQQELLAELGVLALQGTSFVELLNHTARITAEGLRAEYCKVMEFLPAENRLVVRAGVGWEEGVVGHATVGADLASPAGYALHTGKPVISNHLENEQRQYQRKLQAALDRHQILLKEVNHRVKNSLQVVSGMLQLQASAVGDPVLGDRLQEASTRISAVGRAYERLAYNADYENIGLVSYLREVISDLETAVAPCKVELEAPEEIQFAADRAILVALIINELVLNAGKYAYPDSSGMIWVRLVRTDNDHVLVSVRDEGIGLPAGFDPTTSKRLGSRLIHALAKQLGAELTRPFTAVGTNFTLRFPLVM